MGIPLLQSVLLLIIATSPLAKGEASSSDCYQSMSKIFQDPKNNPHHLPIIQAPSKDYFVVHKSFLKSESGYFVQKHHNPAFTVGYPIGRVIPDPKTSLGRVALALNKNKTQLIFSDVELDLMGAGGYFNKERHFRISSDDYFEPDIDYVGKVIALRETNLNTPNFTRIMMHEMVHYKGKLLNDAGIQYPFNSVLRSKPERTLFSKNPLYSKYMHHEEVRAYSNNFVFMTLKSHHRKTLQMIEAQAKLLPEKMPRFEKMKQIRLDYHSIVDSGSLEKYKGEILNVLESHSKNVDYIQAHVNKHRRSLVGGAPSELTIVATKPGTPVVLETEKLYLTLSNVKVKPNRGYDLNEINLELARMSEINQSVKSQIEEIDGLLKSAENKGYFSAQQYIELKNKMAKLTKSIRLPSLP